MDITTLLTIVFFTMASVGSVSVLVLCVWFMQHPLYGNKK